MTATDQAATGQRKPGQIVEMAWDPITRIIGNLGIYTKIDFANRGRDRVPQHVVAVPRLLACS